jgi:uncharacterized protein (DUF1501 family)
MLTRRDLFRCAAGTGLTACMPAWLCAGDPPLTGSIDFGRCVVMVELRGGNDGLNTIVPYADAAYKRMRPKLALAADQIIPMNRELALHGALAPLQDSLKARDCGVVLGVGYPQPNRSHFRGIDIWHGATSADEPAGDGWLARILSRVPSRSLADLGADGIVFGSQDTVGHQGVGPLYGDDLRVVVMDDTAEYLARAANVAAPKTPGTGDSPLDHLLRVQSDLVATAGRLAEVEKQAPRFTTKFPDTRLGRHLATAAKLIAGQADVPVWKVTLDGFDTHADQLDRHAELLGTLAGALAAFRAAMIEAGVWDRVLVMTYSEFGRRVEENASAGTDHGTAAPHFVLGGRVAGGIFGKQPPLNQLYYGDLKYTVDFRSIYASVARDWWGYQGAFLSNSKIKPLPGLIAT